MDNCVARGQELRLGYTCLGKDERSVPKSWFGVTSFFYGLSFSDVLVPSIDMVLHDASETLLEKQLYRAGDPYQIKGAPN